MSDPSPPRALFYGVWVSNQASRERGTALCWGPPRDAAREAADDGRSRLERGEATMCFVVRFSGGRKEPLPAYTRPGAAKSAVSHWEELWGACEAPE